jgi:hypothetical protein
MWKVLGREYVGCAHFHYEILPDFVWWEKAPGLVVESLSEEGNGEYGSWKVYQFWSRLWDPRDSSSGFKFFSWMSCT